MRQRLVVSVALVALIGISRLVVIPASIWEQDEAYFAAAVVEISIGDSQPHPPFFPLWIGLGKLVHLAGVPPAASLQWLSAVLGTLLLLPLTTLWSRVLTLRLAVAASVLGLMAPGVWLLRRLGQDRFLDVTVARVRSAGPESMEDIVATIREGSGGRQEGQPVGADNDREDDEGEDGLEGGNS